VISDRAARRKLGLIAPNTAPGMIVQAMHALDVLGAEGLDGNENHQLEV
jgi:hypothetical protein